MGYSNFKDSLKMQIGLYTLSDLSSLGRNSQRVDAHTRIKETIAVAKLAEQAGLDIFGVGDITDSILPYRCRLSF